MFRNTLEDCYIRRTLLIDYGYNEYLETPKHFLLGT